MEFLIGRTSVSHLEKPCEEAYQKKVNECDEWFVNIDTFDEFIQFKKKYGDIVLSECRFKNDIKFLEIEIYDTYRE